MWEVRRKKKERKKCTEIETSVYYTDFACVRMCVLCMYAHIGEVVTESQWRSKDSLEESVLIWVSLAQYF